MDTPTKISFYFTLQGLNENIIINRHIIKKLKQFGIK